MLVRSAAYWPREPPRIVDGGGPAPVHGGSSSFQSPGVTVTLELFDGAIGDSMPLIFGWPLAEAANDLLCASQRKGNGERERLNVSFEHENKLRTFAPAVKPLGLVADWEMTTKLPNYSGTPPASLANWLGIRGPVPTVASVRSRKPA
jgi:hypothetical protein